MNLLDTETIDYHKRQWETPYRSTVEFSKFISRLIKPKAAILDVGCGSGAATNYIAEKYLEAVFTGIDASSEAIKLAPMGGMAHFKEKNLFDERTHFDGVMGLQFLHTTHDYQKILQHIATVIDPDWMAFSTLLYDGEIECRIQTWEPKIERHTYRNIMSVPILKKYMKGFGYGRCRYQKFEIDIDLPRPTDKDILKSWSCNGVCYSGPMIMPWGFISFERD